MKKLLLCFLLCLSFIHPVYAKSSYVESITIDCQIDDTGKATMVETWDMYAYEGSEVYKIFDHMSGKPLTLISVEENGKQFNNIGNWNINASKSQKTNKCGLVTKYDGYELCFGVGDYGHHIFKMTYSIDHFINQYEETQGIDYIFLSDLNLDVNSVKIDVSSPHTFTQDNSDIWGFGYNGYCQYTDKNTIELITSDTIHGNKIQLLSRLNNTYSSPYNTGLVFEDVLDEAREGSEYTEDDYHVPGYFYVIMILTTLIPFISVFIIIFVVFKHVNRINDSHKMKFTDGYSFEKKHVPMYRDIPTKDYLYAYYLIKEGHLVNYRESGLIEAYVLKWIRSKQIEFQKGDKEGLLFKHDTYFIDFHKEIDADTKSEEDLYKIFQKASGKNLILETKEYEKWCSKHYSKVLSWFTRVEYYVEAWMKSTSLLQVKTVNEKVLFFNTRRRVEEYTPEVRVMMTKIYGLYLFLKDQDNMAEKQAIDVHLWDDYLIYASLFNIADKVKKQIQTICPEFEQTYPHAYDSYDVSHVFIHKGVTRAHNAYDRAHSSGGSSYSGGGGSSSYSGGGSSSSGGGGGGLR